MSLHCGVVGLGFMGGSRVAALQRAPQVSQVSGTDLSIERGKQLLGDGFIDSFERLLERDLDALFVSTPDPHHASFVVAALERGVPVFVEKPLATSAEDCLRILQAEVSSSAAVTVGHSLRMNPRYAAVQERVAGGDVGEIMHVTSRRSWPLSEARRMSESTDLAMYLGVHEADLLHWIVGQRIVRVYAAAAPSRDLPVAGAPTLLVLATFADGALGSIETSWAIPDSAGMALSDSGLQLTGTRGLVRATAPDAGALLLGDPAEDPTDAGASTQFRRHGRFEMLPTSGVAGFVYDEVELETLRFLQSVEHGLPPHVTSSEGAAAVAVAAAIRESLHTGEPCDVRHVEVEA